VRVVIRRPPRAGAEASDIDVLNNPARGAASLSHGLADGAGGGNGAPPRGWIEGKEGNEI
jgi:hypothetical protein